jgi:hypothetical protein
VDDQKVAPEFVRVLVDTTEVRERWALDSNEWRVLEGLEEENLISVHFPEVVVRESDRQLSAQRKTDEKALKAIMGRAERFSGLETKTKESLLEAVELADSEKHTFRDIVVDKGFDVLALPSVDHETLLDRDLGRRKPFSDTGKGYRDALNWHSILELAANRLGERFYWITGNTSDFGGSELHDHLKDDLMNLKDPAEVVLIRSIKDLLNEPALKDLVEERKERLKLQSLPQLSLTDMVQLNVISAAENMAYTPVTLDQGYEWAPGGIEIENLVAPVHIESLTISEAIPREETVDILQIERFDESTTFATATVIADVTLEGYIYKSDIGASDRLVVTDYDWNTHYAEVNFAVGDMRLTYNLQIESGVVESCTLQGIESADQAPR